MRPLFRMSAVTLFALACAPPPDESNSNTSSPRTYILAGNTQGAPPNCEMRAVAARTDNLFEAVTEGAAGISSEFFGSPTEAPFMWYSFEELTVRSIDDLDAHFA